jgi:flagellar assembly protein FliH
LYLAVLKRTISLSNKFIRSGNVHRGGGEVNRPLHVPSRVYGQKVSIGEPFQIQGDAEIRQEIQASLEFLATQHLLEAEDKANKLIAKARSEAAAILEKANAQAKEMLSQVQTQVDGIREAAHEEGFKAGFQEGYADATDHVETETVDLIKSVHTLVEGAYEAQKRVLKDFEKQAAGLVRHVTHRVLRRELNDSPEALIVMIEQAIESLYLSGKVQVVVSAQAVQDLREYSARIRDGLESLQRFEFIADPNLDLHQIYIIGQEGCFDLSPHNQAEQLLQPLESHLHLPQPEHCVNAPEISMPAQMEVMVDASNVQSDAVETNTIAEEVLSDDALETLKTLSGDMMTSDEMAESVAVEPTEQASPPVDAKPYVFPAFDEAAMPPEESEPEVP